MFRMFVGASAATLVVTMLVVGNVAATPEDWQPPRFEIGAFGGVMDFDTDRQLQGEVFGGRAGINLSPQLGFELVVGTSRATSSVEGTLSRIWLSHADLVFNLLPGAFTPYVSGGFGNLSTTTSSTSGQDQLHFDLGGGVKMWMSEHLALRGDMHGYWGHSQGSLGGSDRLYGDIMATVSLVVGSGASRRAPDDTDQDRVPDLSDRCPNTPLGIEVDAFGCPPDTDRDGVADYCDRCASTALHAWVDLHGCPTDDDGDGVSDGLDRCLDTPRRATVDARGCPLDADGDGVYDGIDKCLETAAGTKVDANGCPQVKQIERKLVLHSINFSSGKADILPISFAALDEVAKSLVAYSEVKMEIRGYADAVGSESINLSLTQQRADAVRQYLAGAGVDLSRLRARGYGELDPVAPNDTSEGRAMNRRVEFHRVD